MSLTFQVAPHMAEPFMPATVLASVSELVSQTQIRPEKLHFFDEYSGSFQFDWEDFWDEKSRELQEVHADLQSDEIRILYEAPPKKPPKRVLLQSSVNEDDIPRIEPQNNGLVHTALEAYNYHHNLVIRPDDLWIAILAQFSLYVNRHSAEMRKFFVEHKEGKKKLVVSTAGDRYTVNWGELAESMTSEIRKNIVDPSLVEFVLPNFTTTTFTDTSISAIILMSTMKSYFEYEFRLMCGIPHVTLLGSKLDYDNILHRLETLYTFGNNNIQLIRWAKMLTPVIRRISSSFDAETADEIEARKEFWSTIATKIGGGSGPTYLSGWITAFCVFNDDGDWQGDYRDLPRFMQEEFSQESGDIDRWPLVLDDVKYPHIGIGNIPPAWAEVEVVVIDNGESLAGQMVAGLVGLKVIGDEVGPGAGHRVMGNTITPYPAWFMFEVVPDK